MPSFSTMSICGYHIREAGATGPQALAFTLCNAMAYVQLGVDAGLNVNDFVGRFTFLNLSGSMEMFKEIALQRAARRVWAKIMKEKFGAKDPRSWLYRTDVWARQGYYSCTAQRPLNNLTRAVIGGIAGALSGGNPSVDPPYDEALGLGWSLEATQLAEDASRIIQYEAGLCDVIDPLAGSYYVEALTDQIEDETWDIINKVEAMGGAVAAIEKGFYQQEIARSAYQYQKEVETGEMTVVGVNRFTGENELEVLTARLVADPYDPAKRAEAEERQLANLARVKKERDNAQVKACLRRLEDAARDETVNLLPLFVEAVKAYATVGEVCGVLRTVFGEYQPFTMEG
jgi:methylmalonyl-CoA mutase N-terminal domain/subunit